MELKDVQEFINSKKTDPEVQAYVKGFVTPDGVKGFLETDEGQKIIQPKLDQHFTKGLETWRTNNLQKIVDAEVDKVVKEKYPTETEEQKRLRKLEADLQNETSMRKRAELINKATAEATNKGLPLDLVKHFVGNDEDSTKAGLLELETAWKKALTAQTDKLFKEYGRQPDQGGRPTGLFTMEDVKKMSPAEEKANHSKVLESMKYW